MAATTVLETAGVRRASDLARPAAGVGADRLLPVAPELHPLLPGLRRGSSVAVSGGTSMVLALLARASADGAWCAVVGLPRLGLLAAAQAGIALERLALVPHPGPEWPTVVAALLDGVELVVVAPPGPVGDRTASRLLARARQRGGVLVSYGRWPGAELTLTTEEEEWDGLEAGHGRLRCRELTIVATGRGAAARPRRVRVRLPDPAGRLAVVPTSEKSTPRVIGRRTGATVTAHLAAAPATGRPRLTVIGGGPAKPPVDPRRRVDSRVERSPEHRVHLVHPLGVHDADTFDQPLPPHESQCEAVDPLAVGQRHREDFLRVTAGDLHPVEPGAARLVDPVAGDDQDALMVWSAARPGRPGSCEAPAAPRR